MQYVCLLRVISDLPILYNIQYSKLVNDELVRYKSISCKYLLNYKLFINSHSSIIRFSFSIITHALQSTLRVSVFKTILLAYL